MSTESWKTITGCATDAQKEKVVRWFGFIAGNFGGDVVKKIKPIQFDAVLGGGNMPVGTTKTGTLICDLVVEKDMTNGYQNLHGGCAAFLVDVCTSVLLSAFSDSHVTINLNVDYHQPIPTGTTIEIVSTTRAIGRRILSTRCEFLHKEKRTLLLSGTHTKMPPSSQPGAGFIEGKSRL